MWMGGLVRSSCYADSSRPVRDFLRGSRARDREHLAILHAEETECQAYLLAQHT